MEVSEPSTHCVESKESPREALSFVLGIVDGEADLSIPKW